MFASELWSVKIQDKRINSMKRQFLKWWIYFFGVRFYETKTTPDSTEIVRSEFRTVKDHVIKFLFFKEPHNDIIFKGGVFFSAVSHAFIIQAQFDDRLDNLVLRFNHTKYFFRGKCFSWFSDQDVADTLLSIYLDFIRTQIK